MPEGNSKTVGYQIAYKKDHFHWILFDVCLQGLRARGSAVKASIYSLWDNKDPIEILIG
jgi:hypothetical protein